MRIRTTLIETVCVLLVLAGTAAAAPIKVYPVPWAPESGKAAMSNLDNPLDDNIKFANLSGGGEILIYTVTGEQVISIPFTSTESIIRWNGNNSDGAKVASGVYLWVVKTDDVTETGKLIVIR